MKRLVVFFIIIFVFTKVYSQQIPQYSQRMTDMLAYNPAIAGTKQYHEIKIHSRMQWIGFPDAPRTQVISYHGPFLKSTGIGGYIIHDITGPTGRTGANLSFAYHIGLKKVVLSFGLSTLLSQFRFETSSLVFDELNDPLLTNNFIKSKISPDATFGIFLHNSRFYFGGSMTHLLQSRLKDVSTVIPATQQYFIVGGVNLSSNPEWSLLPSFAATVAKNYPYQVEFNFKAEYQGKYLAGLSYRTQDACVAMAGLRISRNIFLIYSFDFLYSRLRNFNSGSHEIVIYIELKGKAKLPMFNLETEQNEFIPHWY